MISPKARHKARIFAIQALYQWAYNHSDLAALIAEFQSRNDYHTYVDWDFFSDLLTAVLTHQASYDQTLVDQAARPLKEINPVELAILRVASAELQARLDVPFQVVLSEYVDLTQTFGATDAVHFVNAVLDRLTLLYRPIEQGASSCPPVLPAKNPKSPSSKSSA